MTSWHDDVTSCDIIMNFGAKGLECMKQEVCERWGIFMLLYCQGLVAQILHIETLTKSFVLPWEPYQNGWFPMVKRLLALPDTSIGSAMGNKILRGFICVV